MLAKTRQLFREIADANQYRQPGIFCKARIVKRELAHKENRPAIRFDPPRMLAILAETNLRINRRIVVSRHV